MNRLEVHVIFIHIIYDQQLSRIYPLLEKNSTFTQDDITSLKFKTADTPFQFQGQDIILNVQVAMAEFD